MDLARLDLGDGRAGDPFHAALDHQGFGEDLAARDVAAAMDMDAAHPEVAELVLVADPNEPRLVADTRLAQRMVDVVDVFEGRPLAGTHAMPGADDKGPGRAGLHLRDHFLQMFVGLLRMVRGADREAIATVRPEARGRTEVQLGAGRVDQIVVFDRIGLAESGRVRVFDRDIGRSMRGAALGMDRDRTRLSKIDAELLVDRRQIEGHLLFGHLPDADPDVGRDPVPLRLGRNDGNRMRLAEPFPEISSNRMPGNPRPENKDSCHLCSLAMVVKG